MGAAAFVLLLAYFTPLLSPHATIQWDAVDLSYPWQRYFADNFREGLWPFWTPFLFCGFPFLAAPQAGAFYPLNWPFFLSGITPGAIQGELALHAALALVGCFLLLRRLTGHAAGALTGALTYALGGFFAAHSSHVSVFQGAALLPWLLYTFERGCEGRAAGWFAAAAGVAGCIFLAGHPQTGAHALAALALFAGWRIWVRRQGGGRAVAGVLGVVVLGAALAAVTLVPWSELRAESVAAQRGYGAEPEERLKPGALGTLVYADALGALSGRYTAGGDITAGYLYGGVLLLPLAALALRNRQALILGVLMVGVPLAAMLASAPAQAWFVAALGLAMLAALGVGEAEVRWKKPWAGLALVVLFAADLCHFNSWHNPLAYGRASYEEMYGAGEAALRFKVGGKIDPPFRLHIPDRLPIFGPLNSPLTVRVETTGGYNPLELAAWREYKTAAETNHRLLDGVAAAIEVRAKQEEISGNPTVMARAYFAPEVVGVSSLEESRARLAALDPRRQSVVFGLPGGIGQDAEARAKSMLVLPGRIAVRYSAAAPSLLRLADAWYPGWQAAVEGQPVEVLRVNHALMGAVVPAGSHEVVFEFHPRLFRRGVWISLGALALTLGLAGASLLAKKHEGANDDGVGA